MKIIKMRGTASGETLVDDRDYKAATYYGWYNTAGYAARSQYTGGGRDNPRYKSMRLNRFILARKLGRPLEPHEWADHKNGNPLDNRRANLRVATNSQNNANSRPKGLGFKGVVLHRGAKFRNKPWQAYITIAGKRMWLGYFATDVEAAYVYDQFALALFGEFARPNLLN